MGNKKEYKVGITIGGRVDPSVSTGFNQVKNAANTTSGTLKKLASIAASAFAAIQIKDFIGDCIEASKEMETSMAGVAKVVDGLKDENGKVTESYYQMEDAIVNMSKNMPMVATGIAAITEAAGQANIPKDDLESFTENAVKMGIAFDSTAEQAGEWMAAWRTALGLNQKEVVALADKINYLGNTSSEDAIKLSEIVTNIGSLGQIAGMSGDMIAAMGASMTKVNSSVASTGIKNMIKALTAGDSVTKRQYAGYTKLGLDAKKVSESMQKDAQGTLLTVLDRLSQLKKAEQSATISNLFGNESKQAIAPLIANLDNLKEQFHKIGDAALYAGSMEQEYLTASATSANLDILTENKKTGMKKEIGDSLLPLSDEINRIQGQLYDNISSFMSNNTPQIERKIRHITETINKELPNAVYSLQDFAGGVKEASTPIISILKELSEHSELSIAAITASFVGLKGFHIGEKVVNVAGSIKKITKEAKVAKNPIKMLIGMFGSPQALAIGAVAAGITAVGTAFYVSSKKAQKADLAKHFGDVSLSLEELDEVARNVLGNDNLKQVEEYMKLSEESKNSLDTLEDYRKALEKANWKVSIGIEVSEAEYKQDIANFIAQANEVLQNEQYKAHVNLSFFLGENDSTVKETDAFFNSYRKELEKVGKDLQKEVNDAFEDGLLEFDETEKITKLQQKMSNMTDKLTEAKHKARLGMIQDKFDATDLTGDSFKNLSKELEKEKKRVLKEYDSSYNDSLTTLELQNSEENWSDSKYKTEREKLKKAYQDKVSQLEIDHASFLTDNLKKAYGEEFKIPDKQVEHFINQISQPDSSVVSPFYKENDLVNKMSLQLENSIDIGAYENLKTFYKPLEENKTNLEKIKLEYEKSGQEIPKKFLDAYSKTIKDLNALGALANDSDALYEYIGQKVATSPEFSKAVEEARKNGVEIPRELEKAINKGIEEAKREQLYAFTSLYNTIRSTISNQFGGGFNLTIPVNTNFKFDPNKNPLKQKKPKKSKKPNNALKNPYDDVEIKHNAKGGIIREPILTTFAEEGPEAAIPLDGSKRAINLWHTAGEMLGQFQKKSSSASVHDSYTRYLNQSQENIQQNAPVYHIYYSPNIQVKMEDKNINQALSMSMKEFGSMFEEYQRQSNRVSFGGTA